MRKVLSSVLSIVAVAAISSGGYWATGMRGIKQAINEAIRTSITHDAAPGQIHSVAPSDGFELTVG